MRTLLIASSGNFGGGNRCLLTLAKLLRERDVAPTIVVPCDGKMADACHAVGVAYVVHETAQPSWRDPISTLRSHRKWSRILAESRCSIVHANDIFSARSVSLAAWQRRVPVLCHIHFPPKKDAIRWAFRRLPKPMTFVFNSHATFSECGEAVRNSCPTSTTAVIHNAPDLRQFRPQQRRNGNTKIGIVANLIPIKGHEDFLRMASILDSDGLSAEYWVIGGDIHQSGYGAKLARICSELGLDRRVRFLGHRSDVEELLPELDVVVCASHREPFGMCVVEAMACEIPVVATNVGGIPSIVKDGKTGFLVPPQSPSRLAECVARLARDHRMRTSMGLAARRRVETEFSVDAHARAMIEQYGLMS